MSQHLDKSIGGRAIQAIGDLEGRWYELPAADKRDYFHVVRATYRRRRPIGWEARLYVVDKPTPWRQCWTLADVGSVIGTYPTPEAARDVAAMKSDMSVDHLCTPRDIDSVRKELARG